MQGRRSTKLELIPFNPEIERTFRRRLKEQIKDYNNLNMAVNADIIIRDKLLPNNANPPSCIVLLETTAQHFELKTQVINILPQFHGLEQEDPYLHIK